MRHVTALRWSLLTSLGLLPLACGGKTSDGGSGSGGASGSGGVTGGGTAGGVTGGGTAGVAGGGTAGTGGHGPLGKPPTCTSPQLDAASGITTCAEGYTYRGKAVACALRGDQVANGDGNSGGEGGSAGDSAMPTAPLTCTPACNPNNEHEFCEWVSATPAAEACVRGCSTDDDCQLSELCLCDGYSGGTCHPADCRSDDDCDAGYHCAQVDDCTYGGERAFLCQKPADECVTYTDCGGSLCGLGFDSQHSDHRLCTSESCGRPFLVEATPRIAPVVGCGDWSELIAAAPQVDHLTARERAQHAAHWTQMGQMEHASIAAFARFSLQLLALGAPPQLVDACTQALADESAHTKLCFSIASAYAGRAIGPGPLDVSGSLDVTSLVDIVDLVIAEGCFGETSAALEALEAADAASDPVIVAACSRIAQDEQRHAELAFRFVRWALELDRAVVLARISAALAAGPRVSLAVTEVVRPCLEALLATRLAA